MDIVNATVPRQKLKLYFKGCLEVTRFVAFTETTISCTTARTADAKRRFRFNNSIIENSGQGQQMLSSCFSGFTKWPDSSEFQIIGQPSKKNRSTMFDGTCGVKAIVFKCWCQQVLSESRKRPYSRCLRAVCVSLLDKLDVGGVSGCILHNRVMLFYNLIQEAFCSCWEQSQSGTGRSCNWEITGV